MAQMILIGGGKIISEEFDWLDKYIKSIVGKHVLIIPSFSKDDEGWKNVFIERFSKNGNFQYDQFTFNLSIDFKKYDAIIVTGGYPDVLMEKLKPFQNALKQWFKCDEHFYVGISSGALILADQMVITKDEDYPETKVMPGLDLLPHSIEVHYDETQDVELKKINLKKIYCIANNSALIIENSKIINHFGTVYLVKENDFLNKEQLKI